MFLAATALKLAAATLRTFSNDQAWRWTIFLGFHVKHLVSGVPVAGYAATLEDAKNEFLRRFEVMTAAGAVKLK